MNHSKQFNIFSIITQNIVVGKFCAVKNMCAVRCLTILWSCGFTHSSDMHHHQHHYHHHQNIDFSHEILLKFAIETYHSCNDVPICVRSCNFWRKKGNSIFIQNFLSSYHQYYDPTNELCRPRVFHIFWHFLVRVNNLCIKKGFNRLNFASFLTVSKTHTRVIWRKVKKALKNLISLIKRSKMWIMWRKFITKILYEYACHVDACVEVCFKNIFLKVY